jgi:hypothetical protein
MRYFKFKIYWSEFEQTTFEIPAKSYAEAVGILLRFTGPNVGFQLIDEESQNERPKKAPKKI